MILRVSIVACVFIIVIALIGVGWVVMNRSESFNEMHELYLKGRYKNFTIHFSEAEKKKVGIDEMKMICEDIRLYSLNSKMYNYYEVYGTDTTSYVIDVCGIYITSAYDMTKIVPETDRDGVLWCKYFIKSNREIAKQKSSVSNEVLMHIISDIGKDI